MKSPIATPTLLILLLISSLITNITVWELSGTLSAINVQEEEKVPSQTTKFTVDVEIDDNNPPTTQTMDFEVTTTLGEFDANETRAAWLTRHMAAVRAARAEALEPVPSP